MKIYLFTLLCFCHLVLGQIFPNWSYTFGDSLEEIIISDFFIDKNGTVFVTGQQITKPLNNKIYIATLSKEQEQMFELTAGDPFENIGLFITPAEDSHLVVVGLSEDSTGTHNFRTLKLTNSGTIVWERVFGKDGQFLMDEPADVEIDSHGNIIVAGSSSSVEQHYTLVQYSPEGNENWTLRHKPFETGMFDIKDILIDANDNIYGITYNTFVADTLHGTIFKRDKNKNLLWEKNYDIHFSENSAVRLVLKNDTLYVVGSLYTEGSFNSVIVCLSLTAEGNIAHYQRITLPGGVAQQQVLDFKPLSGNLFSMVNESFLDGNYFLHTFVMNSDFSILYRDSTITKTPSNAVIQQETDETFSIYRFGAGLKKTLYSIKGKEIQISDSTTFNTLEEIVSKIFLHQTDLYTLSVSIGFESALSTIRQYSIAGSSTVRQQPEYIRQFFLFPAYPNPFNPSTTITYQLPSAGNITLSLFDLSGRMVKTVVNEFRSAGTHSIPLYVAELSSGIYFIRASFDGTHRVQKIVMLK